MIWHDNKKKKKPWLRSKNKSAVKRRNRIFSFAWPRKSIFFSFCHLVPLITTSIRHLQGEINNIQFHNLQLHWNSIFKQIIIHQIPLNLVSIFQTILIFLFPPSFIELTTTHMNSTICLLDDAFQRDIIITFTDGNIQTIRLISLNTFILFLFDWFRFRLSNHHARK